MLELNNSWHELPTNYSNGTTIDGVAKMFFQYPNSMLGGYAGAGWTLLIFVISFALGMAAGSRKALTFASFISFLFSLYFVKLGTLNIMITMAFLVLAIIGIIGSKEEGGI